MNHALFTLVIPIAIQNLISAGVNFTDVILLGFINQSAMSAVSLATQVTFVLTLFYMGLSTGAGILAAQYWGKKEIRAIQRILNISCVFSVGVSVLFFAVTLCFPEPLMRFFTDDGTLIRYGIKFLRAVSFSYLATGFSQMYLNVVKSMENARLSAGISSACLVMNIALAALCIFVLFPGAPEKAVTGVAAATVCARFAELACCAVHSVVRGPVRFRFPARDDMERRLRKDYLKYTVPVQANYIVWGGALTATSAIIGHVNADMVAANSVASVVKDLAIVLCGGISSGGSVLVGKYLGNGDLETAKKAGDRITVYALLFGILAGMTVLLLRPLIFTVMSLNSTAKEYLSGMLFICSFYCVGKSLNSTIISGIFCAGGDPAFGFRCDTVVMWGIILPLGCACAFLWHLPPVVLYAVISLDEFIKLPAAFLRYRRYRWLRNITREFSQ